MSDADWMSPFASTLGLNDGTLEGWRDVIFPSGGEQIILVEGEIDKQYLELLRDPVHGDKCLAYQGEVFAYGGVGSLKNQKLIEFIRGRYKACLITFDVDAESGAKSIMESIGLAKDVDYLTIGLAQEGHQCIEGLVPSWVSMEVYQENPDVVARLTASNTVAKEAKREIKRLKLQKVIAKAQPGADYEKFYKLARSIEKALRKQQGC